METTDSWEYLVVREHADRAEGVDMDISRRKQELEDDGWELAASENGTYVFRRPLQESQETLH